MNLAQLVDVEALYAGFPQAHERPKTEEELEIEPHSRCSKNSRAHQLYAFLREHKISASPEEIAKTLGIKPSYARMLLWRETNFGQVKRSGAAGHYRYTLAE